MLKSALVAKVAKIAVNEIRKYKMNLAVDKGSSKILITIQRRQHG